MNPKSLIQGIVVITLLVGSVSGAASDPDKKWNVLEVSPATVPEPRLKYRLLPSYGQRKPGNAAVFYGKVTAEQWGAYGNTEYLNGWVELVGLSPKERLNSPKLVHYSRTPGYPMLRAAALCDDCDWQIPVRDSNFGSILLPEVQQTRMFGRFLALQAIAQIRDKDVEGTLETLQTGYALARNVGRAPLVVAGLVTPSIGHSMREVQELLIEQPDAPNLYWAIAWLPRPWVDLRLQVEAEIDMKIANAPGFDQLGAPTNDPAFWAEQYLRAATNAAEMKYDSSEPPSQSKMFLAAAAWYPQAKELLIETGLDRADVDHMAVGKILLLAEQHVYQLNSQRVASTVVIPWSKQSPSQQHIKTHSWPSLTGNLLWFFDERNFLRAHVRFQRSMDALQTVESLRHYAATHDGQLPDSLDQLTDTPAPDDPTTGKSFQYRRDGNTAWIDSPELGDGQPFGYEIHLRNN